LNQTCIIIKKSNPQLL